MKRTLFVLHTKITKDFSQGEFEAKLAEIPESMQAACLKYKSNKDRQAGLVGKLLLMVGLRRLGLGETALADLSYNRFGRPYLPGKIDFNISHSGNCVLIGIGTEMKIGVDVEKIRPVEILNFGNAIPEKQLRLILSASDPLNSFFDYWTKVECVLKAEGGGFSIPPKSITFLGAMGFCGDSVWHLKPLQLGTDLCAHVATDANNFGIEGEFVPL